MLLSSDDSNRQISKANDLGIDETMIKPVKRQELKEIFQTPMKKMMLAGKKVTDAVPKNVFPNQKALKILVLEDALENQFVIRAYLKKTPHRIDMVENGKEGFEKFVQEHYDLILMDMQMPVMDGYVTTQEIRKWERKNKKKPIPIIALTAYAQQGDRQKCLNAGCNDYLSKPVRKQDLLDIVAKYSKSVSKTA